MNDTALQITIVLVLGAVSVGGMALMCLRLGRRLGRIGSDLGEGADGGSGLLGRLADVEIRMRDLEAALRGNSDRLTVLRSNLRKR